MLCLKVLPRVAGISGENVFLRPTRNASTENERLADQHGFGFNLFEDRIKATLPVHDRCGLSKP